MHLHPYVHCKIVLLKIHLDKFQRREMHVQERTGVFTEWGKQRMAFGRFSTIFPNCLGLVFSEYIKINLYGVAALVQQVEHLSCTWLTWARSLIFHIVP